MDTWNLDSTLCEYLSGALHYLADNTHGWPDAHYSTYEAWQSAMHDAANKIANADESLDHERNPYLDTMHHIWEMPENEKEKYKVYVENMTTKWLNWERERKKWRAGQKDEAMAWITKYFYHCGIDSKNQVVKKGYLIFFIIFVIIYL